MSGGDWENRRYVTATHPGLDGEAAGRLAASVGAAAEARGGDVIAIGPHQLHHGDCRDMLAALGDNSADAMVTDPPYGLGKIPDAEAMLRAWLEGDRHEVGGSGFMGRNWDAFIPGPQIWRECFRVLKPGAHGIVFAGQRTVDLMGLALRLAGFEIRDLMSWQFYSGFPKSACQSKALDALHGVEREVVGTKLGLPGYHLNGHEGGAALGHGLASSTPETRLASSAITAPATPDAIRWAGYGTSVKPCNEPALLIRKPISETSIARNLLRWGTGAINIDACRYAFGDPAWPGPQDKDDCSRTPSVPHGPAAFGVGRGMGGAGHDLGRFPANVYACPKASTAERELGCEDLRQRSAGELTCGRKEGSAGLDNPRAGAGRTLEGRGNHHPTVKPLRLIHWLLRLVTPLGGTVLEPFAGSGTLFVAAGQANTHHELGCTVIGAELGEEEGYIDLAPARYAGWARLGFPVDVPGEARGSSDPREQGTTWDQMNGEAK